MSKRDLLSEAKLEIMHWFDDPKIRRVMIECHRKNLYGRHER